MLYHLMNYHQALLIVDITICVMNRWFHYDPGL